MKKILFLDNYKIFKNWASKTYQYKINEIQKDNRFFYKDIDDDIQININDFDNVIFGWNMIPISKYYTIKRNYYQKHIENLEDTDKIKNYLEQYLKIKSKYLIIQDFNCDHDYKNGLNGLISYLKENNINNIITPYLKNYGIRKIKNKIKKINIIHVPHHIKSEYFKNWSNEKKYDIFIFGNKSNNFYPFRYRLYNLLKKHEKDFNIVFWEGFRNYFRFNNSISNENLSKKINNSWITICTSSKFNLLLGKYIETSMSGSVICGDLPKDGTEIWNNNMIELKNNMSDEEILSIIKTNLNDKKKLNEIINNNVKKMETFHLKNYTNKLHNKIQNL